MGEMLSYCIGVTIAAGFCWYAATHGGNAADAAVGSLLGAWGSMGFILLWRLIRG